MLLHSKGQKMTKNPTEILYRTVSLRREGAKSDRMVSVAFSSEEPVERYFGSEVLDHGKDSIDLKFLRSGTAPVLVDHDMKDIVGVVEKASVGQDRVARANIRFGNSERASEVWKDIEDGIRSNVSVGYRINKLVREPAEGEGLETYRATDWTPLEISIVSVPADTSVGVGRSLLKGKSIMQNENVKPASGDLDAHQSDAQKERNRTADIMTLAGAHNMRDLGDKAVLEGHSIDQFKSDVLRNIGTMKPIEKFEIGNGHDSHFQREIGEEYNLVRAINAVVDADWSNAGLEREANQEMARQMGRNPEGFFMPADALYAKRTTMTVGTDSVGGYLKPTEHRDDLFVDALTAVSRVVELGARVIPNVVGDVAIPTKSGKTTVEHVGESGAASESNMTFGQIQMTPRTATANAKYSRKLLKQGVPGIESLLSEDLRTQIGVKLDEMAINGSGSSNEPNGVLNTTGIGDVAGGTNGLAPAWSHIVSLVEDCEVANAPEERLAFLTNAAVKAKLSKTAKVTSTDSKMLLDDPWDKIYGQRFAVSNNVPSTLTKGSSSGVCSALIYGDWKEMFVAMWGSLDVIVDPFSSSTSGDVRISAFQDYDIALRHAQSFSAMKDALTT
jgi:HK97 family phage major capsid protein